MMMLLDVKDLEISYGSRRTVEGVNLTLERGEILAIVGESGSGKTTVIRAVMGCLPGAGRVSGDILYEGKSMLQNTREDWQAERPGNVHDLSGQRQYDQPHPFHWLAVRGLHRDP